ncbi:MAG TPA: ferredoxin [Gudongella oleilytica]|nr:ferredoxin [Gudongella oleilytica]
MSHHIVTFSPTGNTDRASGAIMSGIRAVDGKGIDFIWVDITLPSGRRRALTFTKEDIVILGMPVYAGRLPNLLLPYLNTIEGNGAKCICVVTYGNRHYDDALIELSNLVEERGFITIAAAAVVGQHSFSEVLAKGRPDEDDIARLHGFGETIGRSLSASNPETNLTIPGNYPYRPYYRPISEDGEYVDFRKIKPETLENCIDCKLCASSCPMGSIDFTDVSRIPGPCIKCCACVRVCPVSAKVFTDKSFIWHKEELEERYKERREIDLFI